MRVCAKSTGTTTPHAQIILHFDGDAIAFRFLARDAAIEAYLLAKLPMILSAARQPLGGM